MNGGSIQWLGQAGFMIQSPEGVRIAIDPYLGDSCMRQVGFKRMMIAPVQMKDFEADALLISHEHPDHLDMDLMRVLENKPAVKIYGNSACRETLRSAEMNLQRIQEISIGDVFWVGDVEVCAVPCDHGKQCVKPLGFLLSVGGRRIYFAGDTACNPELLKPAIEAQPDVAILPINGRFGNLDEKDAVRLAGMLNCDAVIPCHYWMFVEHGGNPLKFRECMAAELPKVTAAVLAPGETLDLAELTKKVWK